MIPSNSVDNKLRSWFFRKNLFTLLHLFRLLDMNAFEYISSLLRDYSKAVAPAPVSTICTSIAQNLSDIDKKTDPWVMWTDHSATNILPGRLLLTTSQ